MLQIITGKFFTTDKIYTTHRRQLIYGNYAISAKIDTEVGSLLPTDNWGNLSTIIYEFDEKLEAIDKNGQPSILASVGGDSLVQDMSAIMSFFLSAVCSPDLDLARRLTRSAHVTMGIPRQPHKYVRRMFDAQIDATPGEPEGLRQFISTLVGLDRKTYNAVMKAIRRYVHGLHRIADDLDLAYTLLVASLESLSQSTDERTVTWGDLDQNKRAIVDAALIGADTAVVERVRTAILQVEHVSLGRQYRDFVVKHTSASFFRAEASNSDRPLRRRDLGHAIDAAYRFRSSYVHRLSELPRSISMVPTYGDFVEVERRPVMTLQGLARLSRHVIHNFLRSAPQVNQEDLDYRAELPNVVMMPIAERYWVWRPEGYNSRSARQYLGGFLSELSSTFLRLPDSRITDIRAVLEEVEGQVPGLAKSTRLPMICLYLLFHRYVSSNWHRVESANFLARYEAELDAPSIEGLLVQVLSATEIRWTTTQVDEIWSSYIAQRRRKDGLFLGVLFETAITLTLAESHRRKGDMGRAIALVADAVENFPGNARLLEFERVFNADTTGPIHWYSLLCQIDDARSDSPRSIESA